MAKRCIDINNPFFVEYKEQVNSIYNISDIYLSSAIIMYQEEFNTGDEFPSVEQIVDYISKKENDNIQSLRAKADLLNRGDRLFTTFTESEEENIINGAVSFFYKNYYKDRKTSMKNIIDSVNTYLFNKNDKAKGIYYKMYDKKLFDNSEELLDKKESLQLKIIKEVENITDVKVLTPNKLKENFSIFENEEIDITKESNEDRTIEQSWEDGGFSSIDMKTKANNELKFLLSTLTVKDKEGNLKYDSKGNPEFLEYDSAWNFLANILADSKDVNTMIEKLSDIVFSSKKEYKPVFDLLVSSKGSDINLSSHFFVLMNLSKNKKYITEINKTKEGTTTKIFESDRVNAPKKILEQWVKNFNDIKLDYGLVNIKETENPIADDLGNVSEEIDINETINKKYFEKVYTDLLGYIKANREEGTILKNKNEIYDTIIKELYNVGIQIDKEALESSIKDNDALFNDFITKSLFVFEDCYKKGSYPTDSNYVKQNLSIIQSKYQEVDSDSVHSNIDGNLEQSFIMPSQINKYLNKYKDINGKEFVEELMRDPSYENSHLGQLLIEDPNNIDFFVNGGIKEAKQGAEGITYSNMDVLELEKTKLDSFVFSDRKANVSYDGLNTTMVKVYTVVPSDGSTLPCLQVPKVVGKTYEFPNKDFEGSLGNFKNSYNKVYADKLYDLFKQEQNRINEAFSFREKIKEGSIPEEFAIENFDYIYKGGTRNYDLGAGTKRFDFTFLTNEELYNKEIPSILNIPFTQIQGLLNNTDKESKDLIKQVLYTWLLKKSNKQLDIWNNLGLTKGELAYTKNIVGSQSLLFSSYEDLALQYTFNTFLYSSETQKFFTGNVAFAKDNIAYQKRAKSLVSPSMTPNVEAMTSKDYGLAIIRDIKKPSEYIKDIEKGLTNAFSGIADEVERKNKVNDITSAFKDMNIADGLGYIHYKEAINIYRGMGKYYEKVAKAIENVALGIPSNINLGLMLHMIKDNHVSLKYNPQRGIVEKVYIKDAKLILFPFLVKDTPLQDVYDYMERSGNNHVIFESAIKQGASNIEELKEGKDSYDLSKLDNIKGTRLSYEDWGIQFDVPEHHIDASNKFGVQAKRFVTMGLSDDFIFSDDVKAKDIKKEYLDLQTQNIEESWDDLKELIKTDVGIKNLLDEQLKDLSINASKLFEIDPETNSFKYPLFANPEYGKRIEAVLNGVYKSRVVQQRMNGGSYKQASSFGLINFKNFKTSGKDKSTKSLSDLEKNIQSKINWLDGEENKLDFYKVSDSGNIISAKCVLPFWSKDFIKNGNIIDINNIPSELRQIIGYRIPTQGKSSMISLEIVGFLPKEAGNTIILPEEIVALMGSDFDIDTLYTMFPNFEKIVNKDGIEEFKKITDKSTKEGRDNRIQDIIRKILLEPKLFNEVVTALDMNNAKQAKADILNLLNKEEISDSVNLGYVQTNMSLNNLAGKTLTAIWANYTANRSIAEDSKLLIADNSYSVKFNNSSDSNKGEYDGRVKLYQKENEKGQSIAGLLSEMLSAAVDNAKELIHNIINSNSYTSPVYALILETGYSLETASLFLNQEAITSAYKRQRRNVGINKKYEDVINDVIIPYYNSSLGNSSKKIIAEELRNKSFNFNDSELKESLIISRFLNSKEESFDQFAIDNDIKKYNLSFNNWSTDKSQLREQYALFQIRVARSFNSYLEVGKQRDNILKTQKLDGYDGNSLAHLEITKSRIEDKSNILLSYNDSFLTPERTLEQSLLGDSEYSAINFISKFIPFNTPAFNSAKRKIVGLLGAENKLKSVFIGEQFLKKINYEILTAVNSLDSSPLFKNKTPKEYLNTFLDRKSSNNLYNNYQELIKKYPVLKNNYVFKHLNVNDSKQLLFKIGKLTPKGVRRMENSFKEILLNPEIQLMDSDKKVINEDVLKLRSFASNLIRYSYIINGYKPGYNNIFKYLPTDWFMNTLGFKDFTSKLQSNFNNPDFITDKLIDQIIRNLLNESKVFRVLEEDKLKFNNGITTFSTYTIYPAFVKYFNGKKLINLELIDQDYIEGRYTNTYKIIKPLGKKGANSNELSYKEYEGDKTIDNTLKDNTISIQNKGEDLINSCNFGL